MNTVTQLEDLSNEIFFEIFEYLHALDIFMGFSSLNSRISSILWAIRLHVVVSSHHCHYHVKFLSSHLMYHAHQVLSIAVVDQLRDLSSSICFLFKRHTFTNLESCTFVRVCPSTRLYEVIQQLKSLTKLVSFSIRQPVSMDLRQQNKLYLSQEILMSRSSTLRSIELVYLFDNLNLIETASVSRHLTSITLLFSGSRNPSSIYYILSILCTNRALRHLRIIIESDPDSNDLNLAARTYPSIDQDDLPISPLLLSFDLSTTIAYGFQTLRVIFRCMPNLRQFIFRFVPNRFISDYAVELLDGYKWQRLLTSFLPSLQTFDFHISIFRARRVINTDKTLDSFKYFVSMYDDWNVAILRSIPDLTRQKEFITVRTLEYPITGRYREPDEPSIVLGTYKMRSTVPSYIRHIFTSHYHSLCILVPAYWDSSYFTLLSPPFQSVKNLIIQFEPAKTWLDVIEFAFVSFSSNYMKEQRNFNRLVRLIDLSTINVLEFQTDGDLSRLHFIVQVLLATHNVVQFTIDSTWLFWPLFIDNPSLASFFSRINTLRSITEGVHFPLKYTSKLVQRFPSLRHIELQVYSLDICVSVVDIFLTSLAEFRALKIHFSKCTLPDDPCPRDYVVKKRRQAFPTKICNEDKVTVLLTEESLEIHL